VELSEAFVSLFCATCRSFTLIVFLKLPLLSAFVRRELRAFFCVVTPTFSLPTEFPAYRPVKAFILLFSDRFRRSIFFFFFFFLRGQVAFRTSFSLHLFKFLTPLFPCSFTLFCIPFPSPTSLLITRRAFPALRTTSRTVSEVGHRYSIVMMPSLFLGLLFFSSVCGELR